MSWSPAEIPDLSGKVAIVTGGNAGLGFEVCKALAAHNAHVIVAARSADKGQSAVERIKQATPSAKVEFMLLDVSSFKSVKAFASAFSAKGLPLHILVNNAGVFMPPFSRTPEGFEVTVGTNYVGHVLLTDLLLEKLKASAPSRVVVVTGSAEAHGKLDWDDLGSEKVESSGIAQAARSNVLRLLWAFELNKRLGGSGVQVDGCHPGIAATEWTQKTGGGLLMGLATGAIKLIAQPPSTGAYSLLYAATAPGAQGGAYYGPNLLNMGNTDKRKPGNKLLEDPASWKRAFDLTEALIRAKMVGTTSSPSASR